MHLPEDASEYDAGVVNGGLRDDEQKWFNRTLERLLESNALAERCRDLQALVVQHSVPVEPERWQAWRDLLPRHLRDRGPQRFSRGDVAVVAAQSRGAGTWLPLLVASFVWGWGDRSIGPTRLSWVLDGKDRPAPPRDEIERSLANAVCILGCDGTRAAYEYLAEDWKIPQLGPAFFTKFLYFAGKSTDVPGPLPMILDDVLAGRMTWFWDRRRQEPYAADARSAEWLWRPAWSTRRYRIYLAFLYRVAAQMSTAGQRWTPDLVELLLFRHDPGGQVGGAVS